MASMILNSDIIFLTKIMFKTENKYIMKKKRLRSMVIYGYSVQTIKVLIIVSLVITMLIYCINYKI